MPVDKSLMDAFDTLSDAIDEVQSINKAGLNLGDDDSQEISSRNTLFTRFIRIFVNDSEKRASRQRFFRMCFFLAVMVVFVVLTTVGAISILRIAKKETTSLSDIAAVVASFGAVVTALVTLPQIIANHLFPSVEQDKSIDLFSKVLEEDRKMREFYINSDINNNRQEVD